MKTGSVIILINYMASLLTLKGQVADSVKYISLDPYYFHLQYLKEDSALLIDVRMPFEFRGRRIKDAINLSSYREISDLADTLSKGYSLLLYCSTDYRSRSVAETLFDKGFRKLYNLEGGIVAWKKEGMPVIKGKRHKSLSKRAEKKQEKNKKDINP